MHQSHIRVGFGRQSPDSVAFAMAQVSSLLLHTFTAGYRDLALVRMSDEAIARELVESCLAYLRVRRAPAS